MNAKIIILSSSLLLLSACMMAPMHAGGAHMIPFLPAVVEVGDDSYYAHDGYHYFYTGDRWYYSTTRDGQRSELPRSHWPRETHHRVGEHSRR